MDMQIPDHQPSDPKAALSGALIERLLKALVAAIPAGASDNRASEGENRAAMRELLEALDPRDAADAQLAAIGIAAALSAMDSFVRAARPGVSDETAGRLRSNALAAGRTYAAARRTLKQPPEEPAAAKHPPTRSVSRPPPAGRPPAETPEAASAPPALRPDAEPLPAVSEFQPRDQFGKPIPTFRTDLMTRPQVLATLTYPRDPALEAAAIAEEEAMIAGQRALEAKENKAPADADASVDTG